MAYEPIENYGIMGNMRTVALVGMNGSIDWYCYPYFDSPSIFGAILDDNKGGRFQICPVGDQVRHKQFYWHLALISAAFNLDRILGTQN
jgi:GH15 family glucan-1,4-alpha-glucosidase